LIALEIGFETDKLEKLCLVSKVATRKLGADSAKKLRTRLSDMDAAESVSELWAGNPHPLSGDRRGQFSLALTGGKRLVFKPQKEPPPVKEDGGIDWNRVDSVIVVFVGDYHE
tara:strand:+ start:514 stop:852 length:339 start_codon:yes stop_codon:yes gene_type:complete